MKKILFCVFLTCFGAGLYAQIKTVIIDSPEYQELKIKGQLSSVQLVSAAQEIHPQNNIQLKSLERSGGPCNCLIDIDTSFTLAMSPNDDMSTANIPLPFNFCFFDSTYNSFWINNNGNITFDLPYGTYSAIGFPDPAYIMIAPFWADADTRGDSAFTEHGRIYYKITATALIVRWDSVGYYNSHGDKRNTFQLIITDGTDTLVPNGANVAFCYGDMQWTTGDASAGINGFGGIAATVGINKGDGIDYFQIGRFSLQDTIYDGSYNADDGIDFLDDKSIFISTCDTNVPPIAIGDFCDTTQLLVGQTIALKACFLAPEIGQTTQVSHTSPNGFTIIDSTIASTNIIHYQFSGNWTNLGYNTITFTATDNGTPANTTISTKTIHVIPNAGIPQINESVASIFPNPTTGIFKIQLKHTNETEPIHLSVYQTNGALIYKKVFENHVGIDPISIDLSEMNDGLYFVSIYIGSNTTISKMVKMNNN